jgi:hypothetical protein
MMPKEMNPIITLQSIYSIIEGLENEKIFIQGKSTNTLTIDEIIPIVFKQGCQSLLFLAYCAKISAVYFLDDNTIFHKDILNTLHKSLVITPKDPKPVTNKSFRNCILKQMRFNR